MRDDGRTHPSVFPSGILNSDLVLDIFGMATNGIQLPLLVWTIFGRQSSCSAARVMTGVRGQQRRRSPWLPAHRACSDCLRSGLVYQTAVELIRCRTEYTNSRDLFVLVIPDEPSRDISQCQYRATYCSGIYRCKTSFASEVI